MTLIEPKVFCGPALTTAAGAEQSGIMIADDDRPDRANSRPILFSL